MLARLRQPALRPVVDRLMTFVIHTLQSRMDVLYIQHNDTFIWRLDNVNDAPIVDDYDASYPSPFEP